MGLCQTSTSGVTLNSSSKLNASSSSLVTADFSNQHSFSSGSTANGSNRSIMGTSGKLLGDGTLLRKNGEHDHDTEKENNRGTDTQSRTLLFAQEHSFSSPSNKNDGNDEKVKMRTRTDAELPGNKAPANKVDAAQLAIDPNYAKHYSVLWNAVAKNIRKHLKCSDQEAKDLAEDLRRLLIIKVKYGDFDGTKTVPLTPTVDAAWKAVHSNRQLYTRMCRAVLTALPGKLQNHKFKPIMLTNPKAPTSWNERMERTRRWHIAEYKTCRTMHEQKATS